MLAWSLPLSPTSHLLKEVGYLTDTSISLDSSFQHLKSTVEHNCTQECNLILKTFLSFTLLQRNQLSQDRGNIPLNSVLKKIITAAHKI